MAQMAGIRDWGGRFVVPIPDARSAVMFSPHCDRRARSWSSSSRLEDERGFFARTWCARGVRGARARPARSCSAASRSIERQRHAARHALPGRAARRGEARPLHARRDLRRDRRPAAGRRRPSCDHVDDRAVRRRTARALYVPEGVAHGFQTPDRRERGASTRCTRSYAPDAARGVRWDDPAFAIAWPAAPAVISERDRTYPGLRRRAADDGASRELSHRARPSTQAGRSMHGLMAELYPICRSITGDGPARDPRVAIGKSSR